MQTPPTKRNLSANLPGNLGLPLLGETTAFLKNPYHFLEKRQQRYGNVFKTHLFGRRMVMIAGREGAEAFYNSDNISREKAHPFPLVALFGGINMEMYDGPRHFALKSMALTAFDHAAIAGYLPDLQLIIETRLQQLAQLPEFSAIAVLRKLAIEAICCNVMGMFPSPETEAITRDYAFVLEGIVSMPVRLPGTTFSKGIGARNRIFARIRRVIAERRRHPTADGLSRMLTAKAADGRTYTDEEALLEVHHIVTAGFIVYALMAEAMRQLAEQPALHEHCLAEISEQAADGPVTLGVLSKLRTCTNVVLEAKRYLPLVPLAFGRAKRDFACGDVTVPNDWTVYLALHLNNNDPTIYTHPRSFDPDRFSPGRAEHHKHPMAFIPQGAEPPTGHRCLGLDYSTILSVTFLALLLRKYEWKLPPQNLELEWNKVPPVPRDGLRIQLKAVS